MNLQPRNYEYVIFGSGTMPAREIDQFVAEIAYIGREHLTSLSFLPLDGAIPPDEFFAAARRSCRDYNVEEFSYKVGCGFPYGGEWKDEFLQDEGIVYLWLLPDGPPSDVEVYFAQKVLADANILLALNEQLVEIDGVHPEHGITVKEYSPEIPLDNEPSKVDTEPVQPVGITPGEVQKMIMQVEDILDRLKVWRDTL